MRQNAEDTSANRMAQLSYLADDRELVDMLWKISALSDDARLIVKLMVSHLAAMSKPAREA